MRFREKICALGITALVLTTSQVKAEESPAAPGGMRITSCVVYSAKAPDKTYDCMQEAAKVCNGKQLCDIQIGYNLTAGTDIEPGSGFLGKFVKFTYVCGDLARQRGPYHQNDHATMTLECHGPE